MAKGNENDHEFIRLQRYLRKYTSQRGASAANILRLSLLPFLRRESSLILPASSQVASRLTILEAWWERLLADLRTDNITGSDRNAFYEALSGIMSRPEWLVAPSAQYLRLLVSTGEFMLHKVSSGTAIPLAIAAFTGKVLAYCFFFVPGVAIQLIWLLRVPQRCIDRLIARLQNEEQCTCNNLESVPDHLLPLVGMTTAMSRPPPECRDPKFAWLHDSSWSKYWQPDSGVFNSFLKHYCSLVCQVCLPMDSQVSLHKCAPGWTLLLASEVNFLDYFVRHTSPTNRKKAITVNALAPGLSNGTVTARNVNELKLFKVIREVLHNDDQCLVYFHSFVKQFDQVLQAVAASINVYHADACGKICDLVEEWAASVALEHPKTQDQTRSQSISWEWWIAVAQRMLTSNNCYSEIRALTMIFNAWPSFTDDAADQVTRWTLSAATWQKLFCHWSPLVRSYYHRLLCYRLACRTESKDLLKQRLIVTYIRCRALASMASFPPEATPSLPLPKCQVTIVPIQQSSFFTSGGQTRTYQFDIFDNSAYWCAPSHDPIGRRWSLPTSTEENRSNEPEPEGRRRWSSLSLDNLRKFFKSDKAPSVGPRDPPDDSTKHKRSLSNLPLPNVLCEPQPDIQPPQHRFALAPIQTLLPEQRRVSLPRFPGQSTLSDKSLHAAGTGSAENDLAHWNYGGRSLAEWNVAVSLYESFRNHQVSISDDGNVKMPLLIAEIPWRAVG